HSARRMSATLYSVATVGRVAVLILFSYISIYPDVLICHADSSIITADIHGVNPDIAACPGGRKPFAVAPAPGAGGIVGGGVAGNPRDGPKPDFYPSVPSQAGGAGGGSKGREAQPVSLHRRAVSRLAARRGQRDFRSRCGRQGARSGPQKTPGQDAQLFR